MKAIKIILIGILCNGVLQAQHCKFDGHSVIVIKLVNKKSQPRPKRGYSFNLNTHNFYGNDSAKKCDISFIKKFDTCAKELLKTSDEIWNNYAKQYNNLQLFKIKECYAVVLENTELKCLLDSNTPISIRSRFGKRPQHILLYLKKEHIYPLCSNHDKWEDIKPIEIVLNDKDPSYYSY